MFEVGFVSLECSLGSHCGLGSFARRLPAFGVFLVLHLRLQHDNERAFTLHALSLTDRSLPDENGKSIG